MTGQTKSNLLIFIVIILVGCVGQLASDIYSPALSTIAQSLNSSISLAQTSMASYMIGMSITMLIYGVLSEGLGRRTPLMIGLALTVIGCFICYFSTNMDTLIVGRFITGCGTGAGSSLWRGIFRDRFSGNDLAKYGSYLSIAITFIIPAAPAIGGFLTQYWDWRIIFLVLVIYAISALLIVGTIYKETNQHSHRDRLKFSFIRSAFKEVLSHRQFCGIILCVFITYGAFFSWFSAGSALLVHHLDMSAAAFGSLNLVGGAIATFFAGIINGRLVTRFGSPAMMRFGWGLAGFSGVVLLALYFITPMSVVTIYAPTWLFLFGCYFIWSNAFATAMKPFGHIAGYAGSIYGCMQILGGGVVGLIVAYLPSDTPIGMASVFIACALGAWLAFELIVNGKTTDYC